MANTQFAITAEMVLSGIKNGVIKFIVDPNMGAGTVCSIGDYWFYFGGQTAEDEMPSEFLVNASVIEVAASVVAVLSDMGSSEDFSDEYLYYYYYLCENMVLAGESIITNDKIRGQCCAVFEKDGFNE